MKEEIKKNSAQVDGVPFFIFNRRYGVVESRGCHSLCCYSGHIRCLMCDRFAFSGAQPVHVFKQVCISSATSLTFTGICKA